MSCYMLKAISMSRFSEEIVESSKYQRNEAFIFLNLKPYFMFHKMQKLWNKKVANYAQVDFMIHC